jgi:hypothetical protein
MNHVPPIKILGTFLYSIFGLLSFNLPLLYEVYFAHKRLAGAALLASLLLLWTWMSPLTRFSLTAFIVSYMPHYFLSGFETRYFYLPGIFAAVFFMSLFSTFLPPGSRVRTYMPFALVLLTCVAGHSYRTQRIHEEGNQPARRGKGRQAGRQADLSNLLLHFALAVRCDRGPGCHEDYSRTHTDDEQHLMATKG